MVPPPFFMALMKSSKLYWPEVIDHEPRAVYVRWLSVGTSAIMFSRNVLCMVSPWPNEVVNILLAKSDRRDGGELFV